MMVKIETHKANQENYCLMTVQLLDKLKTWFQKLKDLVENTRLPTRIRFKLKDLMELRQNGWRQKGDSGLSVARQQARQNQPRQAAQQAQQWTVASRPRGQAAAAKPARRDRYAPAPSSSPPASPAAGQTSTGKRPIARTPASQTKSTPLPVRGAEKKTKASGKPEGKETKTSEAAKAKSREPDESLTEMSEEDLENIQQSCNEKIQALMLEYVEAQELEEASSCILELKMPEAHRFMIVEGFNCVIEAKANKRDALSVSFALLLSELLKLGTLKPRDLTLGLNYIWSGLHDTVIDVPKAPAELGVFCAELLALEALTLESACSGRPGLDMAISKKELTEEVAQSLRSQFLVALLLKMEAKLGKEPTQEAWQQTQQAWEQGGLSLESDFGNLTQIKHLTSS
eukprot:gb/GEZN01007371.1/.p1 GENE.gb/GEZN01007371.1/~~gb/GEZN01007371.1/.p1  ORF type:complete len:401 (-),score=74.16 gb/GEZN01007371.1/:166-1368(-)